MALTVASATVGACCFSPREEPTRASAAAVIGGAPDGAHASVVAIVRKSNGTLCSGALVAPKVVLTAAHCLFGVPVSDLAVIVGADRSAPEQTLDVAGAFAYPTYASQADGLPGGIDLGAVTLSRPLGLPAMPVDTTTTDAQLLGASVTVVGYGISSTIDDTTGGVRRMASLTVRSVCSRLLTAGDDRFNACVGDSGGPVLMGDAIVAVVSGGAPDCGAPTKFTRTDAHAAWIASVIAGEPGAPCAACVPADAACDAAAESRPVGPQTDAAIESDAATSRDAGWSSVRVTGGGCAVDPRGSRASPWIGLALGVAASMRRRRG